MNDIFQDPDGIRASGKLCSWQKEYLGDTASYIRGTCGHTEAFTGALLPFKGMYENVIHEAGSGLKSAQDLAEKLHGTFNDAAKNIVDADRRVYDRAQKHAAEMGLPPLPKFRDPGTGDDTPTHGTPAEVEHEEEKEPWLKDASEKYGHAYGKTTVPGKIIAPEGEEPKPWQLKDRLVGHVAGHFDHATDDLNRRVLQRAGLSDSQIDRLQAEDQREHYGDNVADRVSGNAVHERAHATYEREQQAYGEEHEHSTSDERHDHAHAASQMQQRYDNREVESRKQQVGNVSEAKGMLDSANEIRENVGKTIESGQQIVEGEKDANEYDDYIDGK